MTPIILAMAIILGSDKAGHARSWGQCRAMSHTGAEQAMKNRYFGKRGEIHEHADDGGKEISPQLITADKGLNIVFRNQRWIAGASRQKSR